ncbi:MAG: hypothetical protein K6C06_06965 [Lachnospiraceae bacterium]|nr:hypothetical protein [Lachnospiraceae bacterium]
MLNELMKRAMQDEPVYLPDIRRDFEACGTRRFVIRVRMYSGAEREYDLHLPETSDDAEESFVKEYIYAVIYNILSALGALEVQMLTDADDRKTRALAESLNDVFQTSLPREQRRGYGKCLNVNERVIHMITGEWRQFSFEVCDLENSDEDAAADALADNTTDNFMDNSPDTSPGIKQLVTGSAIFPGDEDIAEKSLLGIDIGGTDIKMTASVGGMLMFCKEYDWNPEAFRTAEEFEAPVILLTRLMRAGTCMMLSGRIGEIRTEAFEKTADDDLIGKCVVEMENVLGPELTGFDGIGLSFPDVVINNRIIGGETSKTRGMRDNKDRGYEEQFAVLTGLCDTLRRYVREGGCVRALNDGNMAAYTAAVEMQAGSEDVSEGVFAHSLGTDIGTGWVEPDGEVPSIPLEIYSFVIDLGSRKGRTYSDRDVRSIQNTNTGLFGGLQRYTSQAGIFRLAAEYLPVKEPSLWEEMCEKGLFREKDGIMDIPREPVDMRKPALEFLSEKACSGESAFCREMFQKIGEYLAVTFEETDFILRSVPHRRFLLGRLVKRRECFELIREGARQRYPEVIPEAADEDMANSSLMRQLDELTDYSVAQFAQAVGAMYCAADGK